MKNDDVTIINGPAKTMLQALPDQSVQTCVTSPPYFGLRDYANTPGIYGGNSKCSHDWDNKNFLAEALDDKVGAIGPNFGRRSSTCRVCGAWRGQLGQEETVEGFVSHLVDILKEVRRVLRNDGTFWLNLGDTVKNKQMPGIPWRVAFALQKQGWCLRQDIIWHKPNPMPESVRDRCTKAHEYIFLLTKSPRNYFNADAIRNPASPDLIQQVIEGYVGSSTKDFASSGAQDESGTKSRIIAGARKRILKMRGETEGQSNPRNRWDKLTPEEIQLLGSNKRSVRTVPTKAFKGAHFATFPPELIRPCIRAGARTGDVVLDPFAGSGTTGQVAAEEGCKAILIEVNRDYLPLIEQRLKNVNATQKLAA